MDDDEDSVEDSGDESVNNSAYVVGSEALDSSISDYPPGFEHYITICQPDVTSSLEAHEEPHVS